VSDEDAIAVVAGERPLEADEETWQAVLGYREAMTYVLQLSRDPHFAYTEGLIRSLHFMMVKYDLTKNPGLWRPGPIYVKRSATNEIVYEGPAAEEVPALMKELVDSVNTDDQSPNLIRAAMAHLNLVMIHPFSDGNGRMARCLQSLVLARTAGTLSPHFVSIEEHLGSNTADYYKVLEDVGAGAWHPERDATSWVRFCLTAHFRQATTLQRRAHEMGRLWDALEVEIEGKRLPPRAIFALADAAYGYKVRNATYRATAEITDDLAGRDLKELVEAGLLVAEGERRGRVYVASEYLRSIRTRTLTKRTPIPDPFAQAPDQVSLNPGPAGPATPIAGVTKWS